MATKPSVIPQNWASNLNYINGPFPGDVQKVDPGGVIAAAGHRPGKDFPTAAEHENYQQFHITKWVRDWLYLGTNLGTIDAHIVETDAVGTIRTQQIRASNTQQLAGAIIETDSPFTYATTVNNFAGGGGIQVQMGNSGIALRSSLTGTSFGANFVMTNMVGGFGNAILITANSGTTRDGIRVAMLGTAQAINATSNNGAAIVGNAAGAGDGVQGASGSGNGGSFSSQVGKGIVASTTSGQYAGEFLAVNTAVGVHIVSDQAEGLIVDTDASTAAIFNSDNGPGIIVNSPNGIGANITSVNATGLRVTTSIGNGAEILSTNSFGATIRSTNFVGVYIETVNGPYACNARATAGTGRAFQGQTAGGTVLYGLAGGAGKGIEMFCTTGDGATVNTTSGRTAVLTSTTGQTVVANSTNGDVITATSSGSGKAGVFTSSSDVAVDILSASNVGLRVETNAAAQPAILATGNASRGLDVSSGAQNAILAQNSSTTNPAVRCVSTGHHAITLQGDTTSPTRGVVQVIGQDARPTLDDGGQLTYLSNETQWAVSDEADNGWRGIWTTTGGMAIGRTVDLGEHIVIVAQPYTTYATLGTTTGNSPKIAGRTAIIRVTFDVRQVAGQFNMGQGSVVAYRIIDGNQGNAVVYGPYVRFLTTPDSAYRTTVSFCAQLTATVTGSTDWKFQMTANNFDFAFRNLTTEFIGLT